MYTCSPLTLRPAFALAGLLAMASACSDKSDELPAGASASDPAAHPLSDMELPVSLRSTDPAPTGAGQIEATKEQLRLDGELVVALDRGRVPAGEQSNGVIPKLAAKLKTAHRSSLGLRLQANLAFDTMALVLNTAKQAGIHNAALQVRKTGASSETGWLALDAFVISTKDDDLPNIPGAEVRSWNDFTDQWQKVFDACRTAATGNCAFVNSNFAKGGSLRIELMTSGRGVNVNFFRRGLTKAQEDEEAKHLKAQLDAKKEDFLQGRITEEELMEVLLLGDPSTYALFQFRYREALTAPSPVQGTMAPMCGSQNCGVVVTGDPISPVLKIASLIGAAFPDGTPKPKLAIELPWSKRTPPADLAAFIAEQQEKK